MKWGQMKVRGGSNPSIKGCEDLGPGGMGGQGFKCIPGRLPPHPDKTGRGALTRGKESSSWQRPAWEDGRTGEKAGGRAREQAARDELALGDESERRKEGQVLRENDRVRPQNPVHKGGSCGTLQLQGGIRTRQGTVTTIAGTFQDVNRRGHDVKVVHDFP